mmetsp:Transcript_103129/g.298355  ORF Transcript_103129/g.298355 Transcript_103129/m.298355 type:complete len:256 (+) Transcript_103129:1260-2027(+)
MRLPGLGLPLRSGHKGASSHQRYGAACGAQGRHRASAGHRREDGRREAHREVWLERRVLEGGDGATGRRRGRVRQPGATGSCGLGRLAQALSPRRRARRDVGRPPDTARLLQRRVVALREAARRRLGFAGGAGPGGATAQWAARGDALAPSGGCGTAGRRRRARSGGRRRKRAASRGRRVGLQRSGCVPEWRGQRRGRRPHKRPSRGESRCGRRRRLPPRAPVETARRAPPRPPPSGRRRAKGADVVGASHESFR